MDKIALLPGIAVLLLMKRYGPEGTFLNIYLPCLLLLPCYHCNLPGVPDPCFSQAALIPLALVFFSRARFRWRFSALDVAVFAFAFWGIGSIYLNDGYSEAQNFAFGSFTQIVIPYLLGKELIARRGLETRFARRYVFLMFLVCLASAYEFRMRTNLFKDAFLPFFPAYRNDLVPGVFGTQLRWGFGRVAGPFGHSILFGVFIVSALLVNRWLAKTGRWERRFTHLPLDKGSIITAGLVAGSLMTMSRGPWISWAFGLVVAMVGTARNARKALAVAILAAAVAGAATWAGTKTYTELGRSEQAAEEQASAAYRAELMTQYRDSALERPVWGWGKTLPTVDGMVSIDNGFLFLALQSGVTELIVFCLFLLLLLFRTIHAGIKAEPEKRAVLFALAGVWIAFIVALGTTYMGEQFEVLVFLFAGWAEGRIIERSTIECSTGTRFQTAVPRPMRYRFERVYA